MKCLNCAQEIPPALLSDDFPRRLFHCPECHATHVRQLADCSQKGKLVFEVRLWGHPATTRRIQRIEGGRTAAV